MKKLFVLLLILIWPVMVQAQKKMTLTGSGYLSDMESVMFESLDGIWLSDHLLHNRINGELLLGDQVRLAAEFRNRLLFGETVKYVRGYADLLAADKGWVDLSFNLISDTSYILNTTLDRFYGDLTLGRLQVTAGRQRINWGVNQVWNPNDIFNSYSFFDFDYVERPGTDAIRFQYYLTSTSAVEVATRLNQESQWSVASLLRFNLLDADFQILGGILDQEEYVLGAGFSGYAGPLSVSGESTFLWPIDEAHRPDKAWLAGAAVSYLTPFNLHIQTEYLFNQAAGQQSLSNLSDYYYRQVSLRDLSFASHTLFLNLTYPVTPLLRAGISSMLFIQPDGFYLGPAIDLSLRDDLDLSLYVQQFRLDLNSGNQQMSLGFLRLKWSF